MCQLMSNMSRLSFLSQPFHFYHNLHVFFLSPIYSGIFIFFTAWQERELKMPDLLPFRGER